MCFICSASRPHAVPTVETHIHREVVVFVDALSSPLAEAIPHLSNLTLLSHGPRGFHTRRVVSGPEPIVYASDLLHWTLVPLLKPLRWFSLLLGASVLQTASSLRSAPHKITSFGG